MKLEKLSILKSDKRGKIYDCGKVKLIQRKKGTISANHSHKRAEILYLIQGKAELTIGNKTKTIEAPMRIKLSINEYHKIVALSDILLLEI